MKFSAKSATILGLWRSELDILKALSSGESLIADLSVVTSIPRTSLYSILPRLEERGFVEKRKHGKKIFWSNRDDRDIYATYKEVLDELNRNHDGSISKKISEKSDISIHYGNKNAMSVFTELAAMPAKSRFYGIQPEQSIIGAVTLNPMEDLLTFNRKVNEKKLIVEGIIHESGTDSMIKALPTEDGKRLLRSFANRSADTAKLPPHFLENTKAEVYLYEDKVALVNWYEEFAVIIRNKDVFELIKEMFNSTKYLLERYDQNEKIARKLVDLDSN